MSTGKRIQEAVLYLEEGDLEASLLPLVSATDATAKKVFPSEKNQIRIEKWLRDKQSFITWYLLRGAELLGNISLPNRIMLETALYKWLRCPSVHEAKLDDRIALTEKSVLGATSNGMLFSRRHAEGIILAVIGCSSNAFERCPKNILCPFFQGNVLLNELWGKEQLVRQRLNLSINCWD